jgi:hypothetical protein
MMKKLFPLAIVGMFTALSFSSCKQDYTCTCTTKVNIGGTKVDSSVYFSLGKLSKDWAQDACNTYQKTETIVEDSNFAIFGIPDSDGVVTCHL